MTNELINRMVDEFDFTNSSDEELEKFLDEIVDSGRRHQKGRR